MSLNCRQGDLAIVTYSLAGNEGHLVRCLSFLATAHFDDGVRQNVWLVEADWAKGSDSYAEYVGANAAIPDAWLKPIRDLGADAVDEIVRSVGAAPKTLTEVREVSHV